MKVLLRLCAGATAISKTTKPSFPPVNTANWPSQERKLEGSLAVMPASSFVKRPTYTQSWMVFLLKIINAESVLMCCLLG